MARWSKRQVNGELKNNSIKMGKLYNPKEKVSEKKLVSLK